MASEKPRKQTASSPSDIVGACSPANLYLVQLLEDKKCVSVEEPSEAQIKMAFQVLERLVPELGLYSELLKLLVQEIYAAVYSPRLTGNQALHSQPAEEVTRVPYFTLLTRIRDERNEDVERAISELQHTRKILSESEAELRRQQRDAEGLQRERQTLRRAVAALEEEVRGKDEELKRLQKDRQTQAEKLMEQEHSYRTSIGDLQSLLQASREQISSLKHYKKIYDELQEAFQSPVETKKENTLWPLAAKVPCKRRALIGSRQAHVVSSLEVTEHLYQQLLQVQNQAMDDFDTCVEGHARSQLSARSPGDAQSGEEKLELHALEKQGFQINQNRFPTGYGIVAIHLQLPGVGEGWVVPML
ncbi:uncharacterized protein LOC115096239 [Rhinatrema bivittatum]|uniref:uncharacterized protein LOC115096239 n=1 Tax=Rhinatrema bivittatum TaxID=194408 RepID=UPI00112B88F9|nr:uncharacterized protein LOC115096239 [Rhinatrema bivittatum]